MSVNGVMLADETGCLSRRFRDCKFEWHVTGHFLPPVRNNYRMPIEKNAGS
jgi:hypothetical protein